jgi:hypothetical protein
MELASKAMEMSNFDELQTTADYLVSTRASRGRWRTSIILGVLGIISGFFYSLLLSPINVVLIFLGILLIIVGINARIGSKPKNMVLTAIALFTMGAWNLIVVSSNLYTFFNYYAGSTAPLTLTWGLVLGMYCLLWGGSLLMSYRHRLPTLPNKPSDQMIGQVENIINPIIHAKIKNEQDIIEFFGYFGAAGRNSGLYRAKLNKTSAIVVDKNRAVISFLRPGDFEITETGRRVGLTSRHYYEGRIRDAKLTISIIKPLSLTRYQSWKESITPS